MKFNSTFQPTLPQEDSVGSTTSKDQAILMVLPCDQNIISSVKLYCLKLLPYFCNKHIPDGSESKEVIALIDLNNIEGIPEFVQDLYRVLDQYDVTIYTGVNYRNGLVTCLALHIQAP